MLALLLKAVEHNIVILWRAGKPNYKSQVYMEDGSKL